VNSRYVLDSWALLALLDQEHPAAGRVEELLLNAAGGDVYRALSLMNLGEVFHITGRRRGQAVAEQLLMRIKQLPIHILAVDEARLLAAARLKLSYRLAYAAAFAAAAAAELDAALLTGDPELLALAPDFQIEPLARSG
jgi:predicted nucleic acid-binding protein